jgi:hypothetical protein
MQRKIREGAEVQLYCFFNLGIRRGGWSMPRPGRLTPGKGPVPFYRRLCGSQGRFGALRKISPPPVFDCRTVQPLVVVIPALIWEVLNNWHVPHPRKSYVALRLTTTVTKGRTNCSDYCVPSGQMFQDGWDLFLIV